jgi:general L-amino acid transport system substrate-binding protein
MGPVVRSGDDKWFTVVRWVLFALIKAEEMGITQSNVKATPPAGENSMVHRWKEADGTISRALGS